MDSAILDFRILASRVRMRALVLVRVCGRVCVGAWACGRVHGGGRASMGGRACLRFERVLNLPINEQKGRFWGFLFAGKVSMAE
jgi:hypothetical protein